RIDERLERVRRDVRNVAGSPIDAVDDLTIHVDQKDDLAGVRKDARKRHPHVPGTDDGHVCSHARSRLLRASKSGSACGRAMLTSRLFLTAEGWGGPGAETRVW